jgi:serine/threonine protein kinase
MINRQECTSKVDVWAVGVVIYTLLFGKTPFQSDSIESTYKNIRSCKFSFPDDIETSEDPKDLISKILRLDPEDRPSVNEIRNHPFLS